MKNLPIVIIALFTGSLLLSNCSGNQVSNQASIEAENTVDTVPITEINYLKAGKELALQTGSSLTKQLVTALNKKGSDGAVEFCKIKAISITDSMSIALGAQIKRVSNQPRNPNNNANEAELAYIKNWKEAKASGKEHEPNVSEFAGKMIGYYPIITNQMCMQCHGKPGKDINNQTLSKIKKLYPTDKATGYSENEIRGLFVVIMNKI